VSWKRWSWAAVAAAVIAVGVAAGAPRGSSPRELFQHTLFPALLTQLVLAGAALTERVRDHGRPDTASLRALGTAVLVALGLVAVIGGGVPAEFRVLADETNLLSTSLSMVLNGGIGNITEGLFYYDTYHVVTSEPPARPLLFPAATALVHTVLGYDADNGFLVNLAAGFATLLGVVQLGRAFGRPVFGFVAAGLLAGHPLFQLYVRASGFEAMNMALLTWTLVAMVTFSANPSPLRWETAAWAAALAGQCRYESIVTLGPVFLLGLLHHRTLRGQTWSWRTLALPLTLVPLWWQRQSTSVINAGDKRESAFEADKIVEHLQNARDFFFVTGKGYANSAPFAWLAVLGLVWALWQLRGQLRNPRVIAVALFSVGALVIFATHMAYYLGDLRAPFIARYATSYLVPLALLGGLPLAWAASRTGGAALVTGALAVHLAAGVSNAVANQNGASLMLFREYKGVMQALRGLPMSRRIVVADRPGMYVAQRYSAINLATARRDAERYLSNLDRHLYDGLVVIQHVNYQGVASPPLPESLPLRPWKTFQNNGDHYVRISLVDAPQ
jgi:hypothetical protein